MSLLRRIMFTAFVRRTVKHEIIKSMHNCAYKNVNITSILMYEKSDNVIYNTFRYKSQKKNQYDSDDDDIQYDGDSSLSKDSKIVKFSTTSMRTDIILKSALAISRNKVEQMFYESKIRVNGKKIFKKSTSVKLGDEIDVIKMVSPKNSDHLFVARVEILSVAPKEENISVTARRFKNLLIENYELDPHKGSTESNT